jgi:magnesium chelatase subunit I
MGGDIVFPFTRVVGQEEMKKALLLNIVDPAIGGVLIRGEKGAAKSTIVRSIAHILPSVASVEGCVFHCDPDHPKRMCTQCQSRVSNGEKINTERYQTRVVELPLSATEDRVSGTIDIEHILKKGERRFEPGLLGTANRNVLYVDEVNLLDDHIVDLLLDSAAMGVNYVEREDVSFSHPSRFVLIGTMNPEEGSLRPQLLDRFGLSVTVRGEEDVDHRLEVIKRRLEFDSDPEGYIEDAMPEILEFRDLVRRAIDLLPEVDISDRSMRSAVAVCLNFGIEGHRADITLIRAAKANAALQNRCEVIKEDIYSVAEMAIAHRLKRRSFEEASFNTEELRRCLTTL